MVALSLFSSEDSSPRRRATSRAPVLGHVCYLSENRIILVRTGDVSAQGAFVTTYNPDPVGTVATIRIEHDGQSFFGEAEVVRVSFASSPEGGKGPGMGLRFRGLTDDQRRILREMTQ
jgi:hypothetical protein